MAAEPVFRGLRWGDSPDDVAAVLPVRRVDDPFRQEAWVHDAEVGEGFLGRLGTIQIQSIAFYFFDGQLFDITVRLPDILQSLEARRVLEERYGQPKLETVPLVGLTYWIWDMGATRIEMLVNADAHWFKFFNPELQAAHNAWREEQRKQPAW